MDEETSGLPMRDSVIFGEIQVFLAEKRTALASLRTGIAVFALPVSERAHRDLALLQHGKSDASNGAAAASEPWAGRARLLAGLSFHPPHSPLRGAHPRAQPQISVNSAVYRVAKEK